jgi:hypothetical protein
MSRSHGGCRVLVAAVLSLFTFQLVQGQQTTASLLGTVHDSSGAAMVGVTIKATSRATGTTREAQTDTSGSYSIPYLPAADYRVAVAHPGFQAQQVESVTLQVDQAARVDFVLKVGNVSETVEVSANAALLQTENATVGTVIESNKISDLPLNGRNFIQLAQLIPGVQAGTPGSITVRRGRGSVGQTDAAYGSTSASANGSRDTANRFYLDGVELMDYDAMTYSFAPSVDALSEFKVQTSTYSAEYGGAPGGQVNIITKSGANALRGTLWEFNRNNQLTQSYDVIANKSTTPARLNRNQFGGNIGGPVVLPKLYKGQNRTFFFNWESGYAAQGTTAAYRIVPPTAMRGGDFTNLATAKGVAITLKDPLNAGIVDNVIPKSRLSPQAVAFLNFQPSPNASNGTQNYLSTPHSSVSTQKNYTARIDHSFSPRNTLTGRYVFNDTFEAGTPFWGHDQRDNLGRTQNVALAWISTINSTLVNELRGGWHRFNESETFGTTNDASYDITGKMGLPLVSKLPIDYGPPSITVSGPEGAFSMFDLQRQIGPRVRSNSNAPFTDTLSWQRGRHFLKIGAELDRRGVTFQQARAPRGAFGFDGTYTGSALADFMLGYVRSANLNPTHTNTDLKDFWHAYYFNDDWKVTQRLNITLGMRYDYFQPFKQANDAYVNIYQNGYVVGDAVTPANSPYKRGLIQPDRNNIGPRIGLAWRPPISGETVIRAGYGIYYTPMVSNAWFAMAEGDQATAGASVAGNIVGAPNLFFDNPFAGAVTTGTYNFAVSNDQNMRDAYIQQWNLNIQRKLPGNVVLDVGYVGSKGTRLDVTLGDLNRPLTALDPATPGLASLNARRPNQAYQRSVTGDKSVGNSIYHALQVKAERRVGRGFTFLAAYTFAKSLSGPGDIGGQIGGGYYIGSPQDIYNSRADRSISGFDVKQRMVLTMLYDIPFFHHTKGVVKYALDGWQASTIMTFSGGFPGPIDYGVDTTATGIGSRANVVAGQKGNLSRGDRTWSKWFNTSAFAYATAGSFGTSPRTGAIRMPGIMNADLSANKDFHITEDRYIQVRAEIFNLINHYNPDPTTLDRSIRSQTFGMVGSGVQGITTRVVQLGAKFYF